VDAEDLPEINPRADALAASTRDAVGMATNGYIINAILVLLVVRQIRERRLDLQSLLLPVALVAGAAAYFLHGIPGGGNDIAFEAALAGLGALMGIAGGLATHLRLGSDGAPLGRAGVVAAGLWIAGVGARAAFAFAAGHGLGPAIRSFSVRYGLTGPSAWVAALVFMALADVLARLVVLHIRGRRLVQRAPQAAPAYR
jgi:hypothetical protein